VGIDVASASVWAAMNTEFWATNKGAWTTTPNPDTGGEWIARGGRGQSRAEFDPYGGGHAQRDDRNQQHLQGEAQGQGPGLWA